jgi:dipeptidyl aminopeptidase/acylaminoacyl peptidase
MAEPQVAPYGSWKSPITSDLLVAGVVRVVETALDGADIYWTEMRPEEKGRYVLVQRSADGQTHDILPAPFNARTRVHEYGGGAYMVSDGVVYFSNFMDQRLYKLTPGSEPQPLTPAVDLRYADAVMDKNRQRLILVREDHTQSDQEAVNTIVSLPAEGDLNNGGTVLVSGNDFYANPRLNHDGTRLAWITWNHPNMPWDSVELWVAEVKPDGTLGQTELVAGGEGESIFQPEWSPDGTLYFISDRTNWWNLYRWRNGQIEAICQKDSEFGQPQWVFGMSTYGFASARELICTYGEQGLTRVARLDTETLKLEPFELPYPSIGNIRVGPGFAIFGAGSPSEPSVLLKLDLSTRQFEILRRSSDLKIDPGYISVAQPIEFPTENNLTAHAFFYPPNNKDFKAPEGERPPLLVKSHGGPTGATSATFNLEIQYWTSRGFAVVDVNYGGSTGFGREYRERLKDKWGIVDVDDCVNAALYLVERGEADGNRLAIDGGSAGGYTTLAVLTFRDKFKAGASYFGVSDLEALAKDTHKFESRYLDGLVGPYPQRRDLYLERSPIHHTDQLDCPLILLQGLEDKVVPPSQAELMFEAVKAKGLPVAYLPFEGEQHGFRQAKNIKRSLDAEFYFYSKVFGFEPADPIEPVEIENLK